MSSTTKFRFLAIALIACLPGQAMAIGYFEVFNEADAANGDASLTFLETVATDGTTAYSFLRDTSSADVGGVTAFNGAFSTVSTPADWALTGSTFDLAAGNGVAVVGNVLRFVSFFDNNVYEINIGTGAVTEVVTEAAIDAAAGVNANVSAVFETQADGTIYSIESQSDQLLVISPSNAVSVEINTADLDALLGGTSIGGIGVDGDTIYLGSNSSDSLVAWDAATNTGSTVLTEAQVEAATDDVDGTAGFGDIFKAPDGLVYFYETDSDYILSFDPSDPAGTLTAVITEAELAAGPGSDTINQLAYFDGRLSWTDTSLGFYS
ncbi:MAG: hypothetical protein AAGD11_10830, partial [Planctomycetota bacterium]